MKKLELTEERPGYFRVDRIHPISGARMVKKGHDELALMRWARNVDSVRADLAANLISRETATNRLLVQDGRKFTVADAWEEWFPTITHDGTAKAYGAAWQQRLKEPFGDLAMEEITDQRLERWKADELGKMTSRGTPTSPKTIQNAFEALKSCFRFHEGKRIATLPWKKFKVPVKKHAQLPTEREALRTWEECTRLIRGAAEEDARLLGQVSGVKYADLAPRVAFLLMTGERAGEAAAAGFDDIHERGGVAYLDVRHAVRPGWRAKNPKWERPQDPPKNGRALIPLHPDVLGVIEHQKKQLMALGWYREDGPIFPGRNGQWRDKPILIEPARMRGLVRKYVPEADWQRFVQHSTRHSFATVISVALQGDEKRAMQLTRHQDPEVFNRYRHLAGRGMTENPLPRLDVAMAERPKELPPHEYPKPDYYTPEPDVGGLVDAVMSAGIAGMVKVTPELAQRFEAQREAARRVSQAEIKSRYKASNATDFETAWRLWTAAGRPGERPYQVTAAMTLAYDRTRKDVRRRGLTGRRRVQKNERTWETIVRHALDIPIEKTIPDEMVQEVRRLNDNRDKPPAPGNEYTVPCEWEARKRARASRRAVMMAWAAFLKGRDGTALRRGEVTDEDGKIRFVEGWAARTSMMSQVSEEAGNQENPDAKTEKSASNDE